MAILDETAIRLAWYMDRFGGIPVEEQATLAAIANGIARGEKAQRIAVLAQEVAGHLRPLGASGRHERAESRTTFGQQERVWFSCTREARSVPTTTFQQRRIGGKLCLTCEGLGSGGVHVLYEVDAGPEETRFIAVRVNAYDLDGSPIE